MGGWETCSVMDKGQDRPVGWGEEQRLEGVWEVTKQVTGGGVFEVFAQQKALWGRTQLLRLIAVRWWQVEGTQPGHGGLGCCVWTSVFIHEMGSLQGFEQKRNTKMDI